MNYNGKCFGILFVCTIFIFCMGMTCLNNYPDNDLWARLIAGKYIVETLSVCKNDFLSYTPTHIWYDHEWGASVFFYLALKLFGHNGLIILQGLLVSLTVFLSFKTVQLRKPKSTTCFNILYFALMFAAAIKNIGPTVRCLLFTCVFFSLFLYLLERARTGKIKSLIWLPVIMLFWCNIHGGCLSGLGLIFLYIVGEFLNKKDVKPYLYALFASIAILFINPYGIEYVKFLFLAGTMDRSEITEWQSPFSAYYLKGFIRYKIYLFVMLLTQILYLIKVKTPFEKFDKTKLLIVAGMTYLSVTHIRHQTFFIFAVGTLLYDEFYFLYNGFIGFLKEKIYAILKIKQTPALTEFEKSFVVFKETAVYFLLIVISLPLLISANKQIKITLTEYPRYAVEFLKINNIKGNLLINFHYGSYAALKLYPNIKIFMDGRYEEVYDPGLLQEMKDFYFLKNDWKNFLSKYNTDIIILHPKYPAYYYLKGNPDWSVVFENNVSGVFLSKNKTQDRYLYPGINDDYYNGTLFYSDILNSKKM